MMVLATARSSRGSKTGKTQATINQQQLQQYKQAAVEVASTFS